MFLIIFFALLGNKHTFGKIPAFDGLGDFISDVFGTEERTNILKSR